MIEEAIERTTRAVNYAKVEQNMLDKHDDVRKGLIDDFLLAGEFAYEVLSQELMRPEILNEVVWNLDIRKSISGNRVICLYQTKEDSTFKEIMKIFCSEIETWFDFLTYTISENPKIYLKPWGIYFSGDVSWDNQVSFLKDNNIRFYLGKAYEHQRGIKGKIRQLERLYDVS